MKRIIAFIFLAFLLLVINLAKPNFSNYGEFNRLILVSNYDLNLNAKVIQSGEDFYYDMDFKQGSQVLKDVSSDKIKGLVFYYKNMNISEIKNKYKYLYSSGKNIADREVYYSYDSSYPDFRLIDGKKINVQLVNDGESWIIGYPLILTGF